MKKLVLMFVAIAAISFASCGNNAKSEANGDTTAVDTTDTTEVVDSTVADSAAVDTTVAE
jgi:hypothetical protein